MCFFARRPKTSVFVLLSNCLFLLVFVGPLRIPFHSLPVLSLPSVKLWDEVHKNTQAFDEAAGKVTQEQLKDIIPLCFLKMHLVGDGFLGVPRFR